ncbi:pitrilysin family protein [Arcicella rosea]|uniref:Putative Zn-dependent peptidase n=1 Tax=Arcicella rosea TaxID=502909 RepID=A0A841EYJ4_9BACT|nr:pitrilysin family protein [Arcicella rosea]MBB6005410.1 putative Zn-dependent peptidase [Arcicella rosea]
MILDRVKSPAFQTIKQVSIPKIESIMLSNGIPVHYISIGEQPVVKLEISFDAGNWYEKQNGVSLFVAKMLGEGTKKYSSSQISAFFDQYGAFIEFGHGLDRANITVYGLTKYLPTLLPMVKEILENAVFPEDELEKFKKIQLQTLEVNAGKTSFIANKVFRKKVFGDNHSYGNSLDEEAIQAINRDTLLDFYQSFWLGKKPRIFLSGKITESEVNLLEDFFGKNDVQSIVKDISLNKDEYNLIEKSVLIEKEDSIQSSIRMGKQMMTRKHPDYFKMLVLNETLGGYFGSRLMSNIREEKGLTYGISSNIAPFSKAGYFVIGTDVKRENTQQTIDEIYKEINILQRELIKDGELEVVKNYMIGSFAGSLNTPFDILDRYKVILSEELSLDFYDCYIQNIQAITAEMVLEVANQHLAIDSLVEIVVGGK